MSEILSELQSLGVQFDDITERFYSQGNFKVYTRNSSKLNEKLTVFTHEGISALKVVADFDFTLTKFQVAVKDADGSLKYNRGMSCHKVLEYSGFLTPDKLQQAKDLHSYYYPIEIDPNVPVEEKCVHMVDWCTKAHELIIASNFSRNVIDQSVSRALESCSLGFREQSDVFIEALTARSVPLLIFSAGIADVLERAILRLLNVAQLADNVHVLSNRCVFEGPDMDAAAVGFEDPVIHVFNKHSSAFLETSFFQHEEERIRSNVMLVGDSAGDINMVKGMQYKNALLIGFLNDSVSARLQHYLDIYDIVIVGDPGFEVPLQLLNEFSS